MRGKQSEGGNVKGQLNALVLLYFPFKRYFFVTDLLPYPLWGLLPSRWQQSPRLPLCHWTRRRGEDGFRRSPGLEGDLGRRVFLGGGGVRVSWVCSWFMLRGLQRLKKIKFVVVALRHRRRFLRQKQMSDTTYFLRIKKCFLPSVKHMTSAARQDSQFSAVNC